MAPILFLPDEIFDKIFSYFSFDEVSKTRLVCKKFDSLAQRVLNRGFYRAEKLHEDCMKRFKEQLPRRESERHKHPLSTHCDVLTAMDNRLSLLGMTYMKYVELGYCCFIPGKVLDEIFRVLRIVETTKGPLRPHNLLTEFRDVTTMAMEHFDEYIAPIFRIRESTAPKLKLTRLDMLGFSRRYGSVAVQRCIKNFEYHYELARLYIGLRHSRNNMYDAKREYFEVKRKNTELQRQIEECLQKIAELKNEIAEQNLRIAEQDARIRELEQKLAAFEKFSEELMNSLVELRDKDEQAVPAVLDRCTVILKEKVSVPSDSAGPSSYPAKRKLCACLHNGQSSAKRPHLADSAK